MSYYSELDFMEVKRNINRQGTKILHDIVTAFLDVVSWLVFARARLLVLWTKRR